ncbi:MAG: DUF2997 domain-containing protein [Verrucomicrobia bacterium]|nr:DUF2997 domain-containing protein [Verrucomicrobiota bacterium]
MELQEIDVFIEKNGQVRIEVRGVKGSHCLAETGELEKTLGGGILSREMTPEASETADADAENEEQQGGG